MKRLVQDTSHPIPSNNIAELERGKLFTEKIIGAAVPNPK